MLTGKGGDGGFEPGVEATSDGEMYDRVSLVGTRGNGNGMRLTKLTEGADTEMGRKRTSILGMKSSI